MIINFSMFIDQVQDGTKPHTIRACLKRPPPRVGQMLQLAQGQRTKAYRQLVPDVPCLAVQKTRIIFGTGIQLEGRGDGVLSPEEAQMLVWNDGFRRGDCVPDMKGFWDFFCGGFELGQVFTGYLISWRPHQLLPIVEPVMEPVPVIDEDAWAWVQEEAQR